MVRSAYNVLIVVRDVPICRCDAIRNRASSIRRNFYGKSENFSELAGKIELKMDPMQAGYERDGFASSRPKIN